MADHDATGAFDESLTEFERAVSAAILPGEYEPWCKAAREAVAVMAARLAENVQGHAELFESLLADGVDLLPHIETLRAQDDELTRSLEGSQRKLDAMIAKSARRDSSEEPLDVAEAMRLELLQWEQKARIQESELVAWVLETTHRDMGSGD